MSTKKGKKKRSYLKPAAFLWLLLLGPILAFSLLIYLVSIDTFGKLPTFEELENPKTNLASEVYTADNVVIGRYYRQNRVNVGFDKISPNVINALVATEDERFYEHSGIDFRSLLRVVRGVATGNSSMGGGSTITQQLAKNLFPRERLSKIGLVIRKLKEWVIAVRLERQYTKNEILTMYLNTFDFINNAVGIKTAANVYFNTSPDSLSLLESATLVGMAKNPALFNPVRRADTTQHRRNVVLSQMIRNGFLTRAEFDSLKEVPLELEFKRVDHKAGLAPYFREILRGELRKMMSAKDPNTGEYLIQKPNGEPYDIYSDGLKIYTTINSRMQQYAEEAVAEHLGKELQDDFFYNLSKRADGLFDWRLTESQRKAILTNKMKQTPRYKDLKAKGKSEDSIKIAFDTPKQMQVFSWHGIRDTSLSPMDSIKYYKSFLQTGVMSMDPTTGFVKAWVGGIDYRYFKYDHVKQGRRQVGSTFKPIVYSLAIQEGYSPCHKVPNVQTCFDIPDQPKWCPKNSDDDYGGMVSLKYGLANSINTVTAWVMKQFEPNSSKAVIEMARNLGITAPLAEVPSLCLGVADISLMEMTAANSTFANKGIYVKPSFISRIEDKNGNPVVTFRPETREAISEETAYSMLDLMKGVVDGAYSKHYQKTTGTGVRLRFKYGFKNEIAGKTGTTQNNSDGWFMGLTPNLVTGIWVGAEDRGVRFSRTYYGQGANMALPIWAIYMKKVYADEKLGITMDSFEKPENLTIDLDCEKYSSSGNNNNFDDGGFDDSEYDN